MEFDEEGANHNIHCIPDCAIELKPFVGQKFSALEDTIKFYRDYAEMCGFDVRMSTLRTHSDGTVLHRYVLCNRAGEKEECGLLSHKGKRSRMSFRRLCLARVVIKYNGLAGYFFSVFNESHTHHLVQDEYKQFMKCRRRLDPAHKSFAINCFRAGLGDAASYTLFKDLVGSHVKVGCTKLDFKNFARDLRASASGIDAHVILDNLNCRKVNDPGFSFSYEVDMKGKLTRLFWCDKICVQFFEAFGDVVSFDATYSTNKYNLIFAPFTGRDNHGRCVTFGAGLINHEDSFSYTWLLGNYRAAMGKKVPFVVVTDQDPALKIAVEKVYPSPDTRHRFCIWHIMLKLADKMPPALRGQEGFTKQFHDVIWSTNISPDIFEDRWNRIMVEFDLVGHKWFTTMFDIRRYWISAYFRDIPMGGLFRTTSMSESQNSFFQRYLNKNSNLIEFFMHYGSAIDSQRHEHNQLSRVHAISLPPLITSHPLEQHASTFYTYSLSKKVQIEFAAAANECCIVNMCTEGNSALYEVDDNVHGKVVVSVSSQDGAICCECKYFIRKGLLCRHMFLVMKNRRLNMIPEMYLSRRWSKLASIEIDARSSSVEQTGSSSMKSQLSSELYKYLGAVEGNPALSAELLLELKALSNKYCSPMCMSNANFLQSFYGFAIPDSVSILSPSPVKNKGSGSRLKSRAEKTIIMANKPKRKCRVCNQLVNHDARNCHTEN